MAATGRASETSNLNSEFNQVYELIHNPPTTQVSDAMRDCAALIKTGCQRILESSDTASHHTLDAENRQKAQTLASMQTVKGATVEKDLQVLIDLHKTAIKEKISQLKWAHPGQDLSKLEAIEKDISQLSAADTGQIETKAAQVQSKSDEAEKEAQKKEEEKQKTTPQKAPDKEDTVGFALGLVWRAANAGHVEAPTIPPLSPEPTAISTFMDERYSGPRTVNVQQPRKNNGR